MVEAFGVLELTKLFGALGVLMILLDVFVNFVLSGE